MITCLLIYDLCATNGLSRFCESTNSVHWIYTNNWARKCPGAVFSNTEACVCYNIRPELKKHGTVVDYNFLSVVGVVDLESGETLTCPTES